MANTIRDYSATAASNTVVDGADISEGCSPAGINDAIRGVMADLKDVSTGAVALESPAMDSASLTGNLTFGDNDKAIFGTGSDLQIYYDAVNGNSVIHDAGTGNLRIRANDFQVTNEAVTANLIFANDATGEVKLYHNGTEKLATTATGVNVTGTVNATAFTGDGSALTGLGGGFPSGTKMLFGQTAAPTGWTKITTDDDAALRIVSGTVGSGGSSGLSTALATPSVTGTIAGSTGAHTLSTSEIPSHSHTVPTSGFADNRNNGYVSKPDNPYDTSSINTGSTGGNGSHSHSLSATFSGGTAAINVKYVDAIMASKD